MENAIIQYWFIILPGIGFIIWLVRLESKVKSNERDVQVLNEEKKDEIKNINHKLDAMTKQLNDLCISFAELAGYMKRCNEEKK